MLNFIQSRARGLLRRYARDAGGNYTIIFALALIPILVAIGGAIDLSQAYVVKQRMTRALDAAGLAVGGATGLTTAQIQTMAQNYFNANYPASKLGVPGTVSVTTSGNLVNLSVTASMPTSIMGVIGVNTLNISATSQITKMGKKLEVALVLDNTGSMAQSSKLTTLQTAAKNLIATVSAAAVNVGDVKIAVVPFTTDVNVGSGNSGATWLKWTWDLQTQTCTKKHGVTTCTQDTTTTSKSGWGGCVTDRDQDYDTTVTSPTTTNTATLFPADGNDSSNNNCSLQPLYPLTTNWTALNSEINAMTAGGNTNTTIGLVWGWMMLTQGGTLSNAAAPDSTKLNKVIVFLTDGDNTQNRFTSTQSAIDARMTIACAGAKAAGIQIYSIILMNGDSPLLKACATDPSMYYNVTAASQLTSVFATIAQALSNLRISQ
ncbi:MAG TPA: pilus assembly protein [Parvibaculum sp.]